VWIAIGLTLLALLAFAFTGLISPSKANGNGAYCGAYITQDVTLQHDIYGCVEGGITIAKSGVTVDLNGHTINGLGEGDGIAAAGVSGVTIKNGSVVNFEAGLHFTGVTNSRVIDTRFSLNSDASAWIEGSSGNKFKRLTMTDNGDGGFKLQSSHNNRIARNTISGASDSGVFMETLSSHNRVVRNEVTLAGEGIKVEGGSHNRVYRNTTSWNGGAGIEVAEDSHHTRVNENQAHHNGGDGIFIEGAGTQLNGNHAGCNGGMGITTPVLVVAGENWAGGNGDNLGCAGVVCRLSLSCGTE
jgi:parallel beta-helix repeat protein